MPKRLFLDPERADADGLVGVGGDLSPTRLLEAYSRGIFPWFDETTPILWWSPDPRAIFELDGFHVSRRLARTLRSGRFAFTVNAAFGDVIRSCADRPGQGIWITPAMIEAYTTLHRLGWAHSVEAWRDGELAGGVYGVSVGGLFAGESMFTRVRDGLQGGWPIWCNACGNAAFGCSTCSSSTITRPVSGPWRSRAGSTWPGCASPWSSRPSSPSRDSFWYFGNSSRNGRVEGATRPTGEHDRSNNP